MAIAIAGTPAGVDRSTFANGETATIALSGSNRLVLGVMVWDGAATYSAMRWNGSGGELMTQLGSTYTFNTTQHIALAYLIAPSEGTYTVYGALSTTAAQFAIGGSAWTGVDQSTPIAGTNYSSNTGEGTAATITFSSATGSMCVDIVFSANGTVTITGGQTPMWELESIAGTYAGAQAYEAGAASVTMSYTVPYDPWAMLAVSLNEATGGAPTITQEGYRWRMDDGDEANATWAAAQDSGITAPANAVRRIRVVLDTSGDANAANFRLEYKEANDANYTVVS